MVNRRFVEYFENKVEQTIKQNKLFNKKEKILVACSGGKDSTTVLDILRKKGYKVEAVTIDVGVGNYSKINLGNLRLFCKKNRIKLHEYSFRTEFGYSLCYIVSLLNDKGLKMNSCSICGVLRRNLINKKARLLRAKKLVTGHNLDDEAQNIMMNLFRNDINRLRRLGPKTGIVEDEKIIPRVKPLYFISEKEVIKYSKIKKYPVKYEHCPCSSEAYRRFILNNLNELEKKECNLKINIINKFLEMQKKIRYNASDKIKYCKKCGEPSNKEICRVCELIKSFK